MCQFVVCWFARGADLCRPADATLRGKARQSVRRASARQSPFPRPCGAFDAPQRQTGAGIPGTARARSGAVSSLLRQQTGRGGSPCIRAGSLSMLCPAGCQGGAPQKAPDAAIAAQSAFCGEDAFTASRPRPPLAVCRRDGGTGFGGPLPCRRASAALKGQARSPQPWRGCGFHRRAAGHGKTPLCGKTPLVGKTPLCSKTPL